MVQLVEVILEVVDDTHDDTIIAVITVWSEWLEAYVTQSNNCICPVICGIGHLHVLQVVLNLVHLLREGQ